MRIRVGERARQPMPCVGLDRESQAVIVGNSAAVEKLYQPNSWIGSRGRKITEAKAVLVVVAIKFVISIIANVVCGDDGLGSQGVLDFKIPFHILGIGKIAADVIQSRSCSASGRKTRSGQIGIQIAAAEIVGVEGSVALLNQGHAAGWECRCSRANSDPRPSFPLERSTG